MVSGYKTVKGRSVGVAACGEDVVVIKPEGMSKQTTVIVLPLVLSLYL